MFIVGAVLHSFRGRLPFQFHDLYRFEVKDFKTDMISNPSTAEKSIPCFFRVFFFCSLIHPRPSKRSEPAKKAKINKHRGQLTCPKAQPHFQMRLAPKFQDGAGIVHWTSKTVPISRRNWQKWNWKEIDLLNNRVTSLGSFTGIRFVENDDCFNSFKWHLN